MSTRRTAAGTTQARPEGAGCVRFRLVVPVDLGRRARYDAGEVFDARVEARRVEAHDVLGADLPLAGAGDARVEEARRDDLGERVAREGDGSVRGAVGGFSSVLHAASFRYGGYYFSRSTELSDSVEASCVAPGRLARARRRGASRAGSNRRSGTSDRVEVVFYLGGMALCPTLLVISNGWLIAC